MGITIGGKFTGLDIGGLSIGGLSGISGNKPDRPADATVGGKQVWFEAQGDQISAQIGSFGSTVTLGAGATSSMQMTVNGESLDLHVDGNRLTVNGESVDVAIHGDNVVTTPVDKSRDASTARPQHFDPTPGRAGPIASRSKDEALGSQLLGNMIDVLTDVILPNVMPASGLAARLASESWDDGKLTMLKAHVAGGMPVNANELPAILETFDWDKGRLQALGALQGRCVGVANGAALIETFDWDENKKKALPLLQGL